MKSAILRAIAGGAVLLVNSNAGNAADRFVSPFGRHEPPFTSWETAATNIQDAIDAASPGDVIWVTNGVYATGGKVVSGSLTNRVALDKPVTVRSVNGPWVTIIRGAGTTNGPTAVRCAWLTNQASLIGFTLEQGATSSSGSQDSLVGGAIWCSGPAALVQNCVIRSNVSHSGSIIYRGTIRNSLIHQHLPGSNSPRIESAVLINSTIVSNYNLILWGSALTNCIVWANQNCFIFGCTSAWCCLTPFVYGAGNIQADPQFAPDGYHLTSTSPCRGAGTNVAQGCDIDGQAWCIPPSMGCDEFAPEPLVLQPAGKLISYPLGFTINAMVLGEAPMVYWWLKDGTPIPESARFKGTGTTNLVVDGLQESDVGWYQLVASNAWGMATSAPIQVTIHYVDARSSNPVPPYLSWDTAAQKIQDAIDAAGPVSAVLVAPGVYNTGGKAVGEGPTNRVALYKPVAVVGVGGPDRTVIEGAWDPVSTNGPAAVRCAWLTNGAALYGFTIRNGATWDTDSSITNVGRKGGGAFCITNTDCFVVNCVLSNNWASYAGGGAHGGTLINCLLVSNVAMKQSTFEGIGGGAAAAWLRNCRVIGNYASSYGGGVMDCELDNCVVAWNRARGTGGVYGGVLRHCTVVGNVATFLFYPCAGGANGAKLTNCVLWGDVSFYSSPSNSNYEACTFAYSCTAPLPAGEGNISADPRLLEDWIHIAEDSPCRGAGLPGIASGQDIDGQTWTDRPSMGCDEWHPAPIILKQPRLQLMSVPLGFQVDSVVAGKVQSAFWWYKDDQVIEPGGRVLDASGPTLRVRGFDFQDAGLYRMVVSNEFGAATSSVVALRFHCVDAGSANPQPPYSNWATAARTIQDAVDVAEEGAFILVTNGVYASGGKAMAGDLTNRVAVYKPVSVIGLCGPDQTIIEGVWDGYFGWGQGAVRCVWLGEGATLYGFTVRSGATRTSADIMLSGGGGLWCASTNAWAINCVVVSNSAYGSGGGVYRGTLLRCRIIANRSPASFGVWGSVLQNCVVAGNDGGGVYGGVLINCTVVSNRYCGASNSRVINSIVYFNDRNISSSEVTYSCTSPLQPGTGNISSDPELIDGVHLALSSPCRGAGAPGTVDTDIDGEPWASPPSMGCDEVWEDALVGPLGVGLRVASPPEGVEIAARALVYLAASLTGRVSCIAWDFGDGTTWTNRGGLSPRYTWLEPGLYVVRFTAYNLDNPEGVSVSMPIQVVPLKTPSVVIVDFATNQFKFGFESQYNVTYVIDYTTNLAEPIQWQELTRVWGNGAWREFTDNNATNEARFYRLRIP